MEKVKQTIILRTDLRNTDGHKLPKGKFTTQATHVVKALMLRELRGGKEFEFDLKDLKEDFTLHCEVKMGTDLHTWLTGSFTGITLGCNSEEELLKLYQEAKDKGLKAVLIKDSGFTEFGGVPTYTAVGIGPHKESLIDPITGHLKGFR